MSSPLAHQNRHRVTVHSAAMFSTWLYFPADHICFDMGDGMASRLRHKLIRVNTVALSHGHRDHVSGLFMFLNVRCNHEGPIEIVYPRGAFIINEMRKFMPTFDRGTRDRVTWTPIGPGDVVPLSKKKLFLRAFATDHYRIDDGEVRSLGYHLFETKKKVRAEFRDLGEKEIFGLIKEKGRDAILQDIEEVYMTYSGDTAALSPDDIAGTPLLFHEATFLNEEDREAEGGEARYHRHSTLDETMRAAVDGKVGHLALYHISTRYNSAEVIEAVKKAIQRYKPDFPISVAMPGAYTDDILKYNLNNGGGASPNGDGSDQDETSNCDSADNARGEDFPD